MTQNKMTTTEATAKIKELMDQVDEILSEVASIADEHDIIVHMSDKHFYGGHSRSPSLKVAGYDEHGDPIDENGEYVWESSYDGYWVASSELC